MRILYVCHYQFNNNTELHIVSNEALRNELVSVKAQNEAKSNQIMRLEEELKSRNIESEDIYKKIEAVLGR